MRVVSSFSRVRISMDSFFCMNFHLLVYVSYQPAMLRGLAGEKRLSEEASKDPQIPRAAVVVAGPVRTGADHCATP